MGAFGKGVVAFGVCVGMVVVSDPARGSIRSMVPVVAEAASGSLSSVGDPPGVGKSTAAVPEAVGYKPAYDLSVPASEPGLVTPSPSKPDTPAPAVALPGPVAAVDGVSSGFDPATSTEIAGNRSVMSSTYANADGTRSSRFSTQALNYPGPSGALLPVDNRLVVDKSGVVRNAANEWTVEFGSASNGVAIDTGRGVVGWRAQSAEDVAPVVQPDGESVRYVDVWPGVDLVYRVRGSSVEEYIELKDRAAAASFAFDVKGAAFAADGKGGWVAGGTMASADVTVPRPLSTDASGAMVADRVAVSMSTPVTSASEPVPMVGNRAADVNQSLTVNVDPAWLKGLPASSFPVRIDPSVTIPPSCCDPGWQPVQSYSANGMTWPGLILVGDSVQWRTVIAYDISDLYGSNINGAHLVLDPDPVGTGVRSIYGYVASMWGWQNPTGSPVIWDSVNADWPYDQPLAQSDALSALYNGWTTVGNGYAALLLTGTETAGNLTGGLADLWLDYDTFVTPPSIPTTSTSGYRASWGFNAPPQDDDYMDTYPEGYLPMTYWASTGAPCTASAPDGTPCTSPGSNLIYWQPTGSSADLSAGLNQTVWYGVYWDDAFVPTPWTQPWATYHADYRTIGSFTPVNRVPVAATLSPIDPSDGDDSQHALTVNFRATAGSDADGDAVSHQIFWCDDDTCQPASRHNVTTTVGVGGSITGSWGFQPSTYNKTYHWGVTSSDWHDATTSVIRSFMITNQPPVVTLTAPVEGALYEVLPMLQATISDADSDPVNYRFVVTPKGGAGTLGASPWQGLNATPVAQPLTPWQVPAALVSGRGYEWRVEVKDASGVPIGIDVHRSLSAQGRFGADAVSPMQSVGPVSVNLATGNVFATVGAGRSMATVGGAASVGLAYNSKDLSAQGFDGVYKVGADVKLSRLDQVVSLQWPSGSPAESIPVGPFTVQWKGYMTVPQAWAGSWSFGGSHDGSLTIKVGAPGQTLPVVYSSSTNVDISDPAAFVGSTPLSLAAGQVVQVQIDYTHTTWTAPGGAWVQLRAKVGATETPMMQSWFISTVPTLPPGWVLSGDSGLGAVWNSAKVMTNGVELTAVDGSEVTFQKETSPITGVVSYATPQEFDDLLVVNSDGTMIVHGADGVDTSFTKDGVINEVTTAADDLKKAGAKPGYGDGGLGGATPRLIRLEDRLNPTRAITLSYKPAGSGGSCPQGVAPFDAYPPDGMLCKIDYPDGSSTRLFYQVGLLARISDPGDEAPNAAPEGRQVTDLRWTLGRLTSVVSPFGNDVINNQALLPTGRRLAVADMQTDIVWNAAGKPATVTQPRPSPAPALRPQATFGWLSASQTTVTIAGITGVSRTVTFDAAGRITADMDAVGRTTSTVWAGAADMVLKTTSAGRTSSTVYDKWWHTVDSYGPAVSTCFVATAPPADKEYLSYPPTTGCAAANSVPKSHTDYDHNLAGLQGTYWAPPNSSFDGHPTSHSMAIGGGAINYDYTTNPLSPPGIAGSDNWSARYTGAIYLPSAGTWTFRLSVAPADTVKLFFDDVHQATLTGSGSTWLTTDIIRTYLSTETYPLMIKVRIDQSAGQGASGVKLQWQNPPSIPTLVDIPAAATKPGFWYPTRSTVTDAGTGVTTSFVTETRFDEGIDPVYGIATSTTVDPAGLALKTINGFEAPGPTSLLRRTRRTLPAFATAPADANSTSYTYWGDSETSTNPCVVGSPAVLQSGLQKRSTSATTATGTAIITETVYDILGRHIATRYLPDTAYTCTTYDARGRVTQVKYPADSIYPSGRTVTTTYRAPSSDAPTGDIYVTTMSDNSVTGSPNNSTITTVLDALGRQVSYTDVWGKTTTSTYDQAGRLSTTTAPAGTFGYGYDSVGRLTSETLNGSQMITPTYSPDTDTLDPGVLTQVIYPSGTGNGGNGTKGVFTRDTLGRMSSITWTNVATGAVITSDTVTRSLTGKVLTDTIDGAATPAWTYAYDAAGRLSNATGSGHAYAYGYAASGGCGIDTAAGKNSNRTSLTDNAVVVANYCYDNADRLTSYGTTAGGYDNPVYDAHGNTTQLAGQALTYDYSNRHLGTYLPNQTTPTTSVVYQRDATDRIVSRTSTVVTATPIPTFRAVSTASTPGGTGGTTLAVSRPAGTQTGDLLVAAVTIRAGTTPAVTAPTGWTLVRDSVANSYLRLLTYWRTATGSDPTSWTWTLATAKPMAGTILAYSNVDNVTPVDKSKLDYDLTTARTHTAPSVTTTVANDLDLAIIGVDDTTTFNPATGLTERVDNPTTSATGVTIYVGERIQATPGATGARDVDTVATTHDAMTTITFKPTTVTSTITTHHYTYSGPGDTIDTVTDSTGTIIVESTVSLPGGASITKRGGSADVWTYPNIHGDTQATADTTGTKQGATYTYDPYGRTLTTIVDNQAGNIDNAWLGQHQRPLEHETGLTPLIEMGARGYNPTLGRLLEQDPVEGGSDNGYDYVNGDPINDFDLGGTCSWRHPSCYASSVYHASVTVKKAAINAPATAFGVGLAYAGGGKCGLAGSLRVVCSSSRYTYKGRTMTFGNTVVSPNTRSELNANPQLLAHEFRHMNQWAVLGPVGFPLAYGGASIYSAVVEHHPADCNAFERSAGYARGGYEC